MALSSNNCQTDFNSVIVQTSATTTADNNILTDTTGSVYTIVLDNSSGSGIAYLKLYDTKEATHGTTEPVLVTQVAASTVTTVQCASGFAFATALSTAASTSGGTGSGGASPSGTFKYTIFGS